MYFWNIEKLKEDIVAERFSEKNRFAYLLIYVVLAVIVMEAFLYIEVENLNIWDVVSSIGNIVITIVGTFFAYEANGAREGKDFLGRYLSIGFVMSIRFLALLVPIMIALIFLNDGERTRPLESILLLAWLVFFFVRVCKHIGDVESS